MDAGPHPELRELLFADLPAARAREVFARGGPEAAPLVDLADAALARDTTAASLALARVRGDGNESRMRLQAWALAREAGLAPAAEEASGVARAAGAAEAGEVLGVVVDMGLDEGLDTLAAFADGSARYINHSGATVIWDAPGDPAIGEAIETLLAAGRAIADATGLLVGPRPPAPAPGLAAIWVLTGAGVHLGIGPAGPLSADPLGGPLLDAAVRLMQLLIDRSSATR